MVENDKDAKREHKIFIKTLQKEYTDMEVCGAHELKLPKSNSTGSLTLDINLHIPCYDGAIVEIISNEGAGKTTLALSIMAEGAKRGKQLLYIDQERALQRTLVDSFPELREPGVLEIVSSETGEGALGIAEAWALQYPGSITVVDSVDALIPSQVEQKALGETDVGSLPMLMSRGCRKLSQAVGKSGSVIIFINQWRTAIGTYGDPNKASGGKALPFYARQRIELLNITSKRRIMDDDGVQIGHIVKFKVLKNKVAPPFVSGEFPLIYSKGIDIYTELATLAGDFGIIEMDKKYYLIPNDKGEIKKRPKATVVNMLRADPEFYQSTLDDLKELYPETFSSE